MRQQGPARDGDYISVASPGQAPGASVGRTLVKEGNPLKVRAPGDPGEYEVRYILARGGKLLAKAAITINPVTAEVRPPASAAVGAEFEVTWQGPGYAEDFIALARPGQPPGGSVSSAKVRPGSPVKLRAPKEPGSYEIRYVLGRGNRLLAKVVIAVESPSP
jgi:Ca-activated chloride channel family protein